MRPSEGVRNGPPNERPPFDDLKALEPDRLTFFEPLLDVFLVRDVPIPLLSPLVFSWP